MSNYFNAKFSCNENYLIAVLLKDSYRIGDIIQNGRENLDPVPEAEKTKLVAEFEAFKTEARKYPAVKSLLDYGENFDRLPESEHGKYNKYMVERVSEIAMAENDEQFVQIEGEEVLQAFNELKQMPFFKSILNMALEHKEVLETDFSQYKDLAEEALEPILKGQIEKKAEILVIPPQLFYDPYTLGTNGDIMKSSVSFPKRCDVEFSNMKVVAMLHEIMHEYIEKSPSEQFKNETQSEIYEQINHSLVELATNCELGNKICGAETYFKIMMHNEKLDKRWIEEAKDEERVNKDFFIKQGINFPPEFEFKSITKYHPTYGMKETTTERDELGNDKIRGITYPYFLLFKNRENKNQMKQTISEIERDKEKIIDVYGEDFYNWISNPEYLKGIQGKLKEVGTIVDLNDFVAKDAFGIEKIRTKDNEEKNSFKDSIKVDWTLEEQNEFSQNISQKGIEEIEKTTELETLIEK